MYNHDPEGSRWDSAERVLGPHTVGRLGRVWAFPTKSAVAGTPAVVHNVVYAVDALGTAYAIGPGGKALWRTQVAVRTRLGPKVTDSPLVTDHRVIFGDLAGFVHGLDVKTGAPRWRVRPNPHHDAVVFSSGTLIGNDKVAIGVSSVEEFSAARKGYRCCTFRGSVVLLDANSGGIRWQTYLAPKPHANPDGSVGPSGVAIWSSPTYDPATGTIYVTTGNNYSYPTTRTSDAIVALKAANGHIRWVNQRTTNDQANVTTPPEDPKHPDFDFGDSPEIYRIGARTLVGAGQKSGVFHVLDANTGRVVHHIRAAPPGGLGGLFADSAVAGSKLYANGTDWPYVYTGGKPLGGNLSAISGDGSRILWTFKTAKPNLSGVAVANAAVYFQSLDGFLYVLGTRTGKLLKRIRTSGQFSGPAISRGRVYLGTGDILSSLFDPFLVPGPGSVVAFGIR
jgi:polyvinyl alcohol dehydrogenase (cytochrome)